MKLLTTG